MKATEEQGLKTIALDKAEPGHQSFTEKASKKDFFAKGSLKDRPDKDDQYRLPGPSQLMNQKAGGFQFGRTKDRVDLPG